MTETEMQLRAQIGQLQRALTIAHSALKQLNGLNMRIAGENSPTIGTIIARSLPESPIVKLETK